MQTRYRPVRSRRPVRSTRAVGYVAAVLVNTGMLIVVPNLLTWGWPRVLTADFDRLVGIISISLMASILFNLAYLWYDPSWFRFGGQAVTGAISLVVMIRGYQVFPFDFSGWTFDPTGAMRIALVAGMIGVGIAIVVEFIKIAQVAIDATTSP